MKLNPLRKPRRFFAPVLLTITLGACVSQAEMGRLQAKSDRLLRELEYEKQRLALVQKRNKQAKESSAQEKTTSPAP